MSNPNVEMSEEDLSLIEDDEPIQSPEDTDDTVSTVIYDIASHGVDYDVEGLVKRLNRGDILIPPFQRDYVWNISEASRLVESILLGLPIPGVFLARDSETNQLLVIDGQQRLKSLQFYYNGFFNPKPDSRTKRTFKLKKVQERFEGLEYSELPASDRRTLDDAAIHATIIKQETPSDDNTSIYHVFERLNTGGRKLVPQEIRVAIYMGPLNDMISRLNDGPVWRKVYGKKNTRLKDQELILRFFAMYYGIESYEKPIKEFLNKFNKKHRNLSNDQQEVWTSLFERTIQFVADNGGKTLFQPEGVFNTNTFESVMVGIARAVEKNDLDENRISIERLKSLLFKNGDYMDSVTRATSDGPVVKKRHDIVHKAILDSVDE